MLRYEVYSMLDDYDAVAGSLGPLEEVPLGIVYSYAWSTMCSSTRLIYALSFHSNHPCHGFIEIQCFCTSTCYIKQSNDIPMYPHHKNL